MELCIIKLGALGDVIRTLPLAVAIKKLYPGSKITWITKENAVSIAKKCEEIDGVFTINYNGNKVFDALYNLDIEKEATDLAAKIKAKTKKGFYSGNGYPLAYNFPAEYYLNTIYDDELKKSNKKTYQEMVFEAAEIPYHKEKFNLELNEDDMLYAENFMKKRGKNGKIVGIHIGSSPRWPSKGWHEEKIEELIIGIKKKGFEVILFAGPDDIKKQQIIRNNLERKKVDIFYNDPKNTLLEFASLVDLCQCIICSDSLALHVSLALNKKTIGLFFCTSPDEIEGYGILTKVVSSKLEDFFPQRMDEFDENLVKSINAEDVLAKI